MSPHLDAALSPSSPQTSPCVGSTPSCHQDLKLPLALRQRGMAAGSAEPVTTAAKGLEVATLCLLKVSWTPPHQHSASVGMQIWKPCGVSMPSSCTCFRASAHCSSDNGLICVPQANCIPPATRKLPDYLVRVLLMPKARKAFSEVYSCTQML